MGRLRRWYLHVAVGITGGCILVLEVLATRILAPYFGNTIYTISSVLSVVLAALAVGYYLGGRVADRRPSKRLFFAIILAGGLGVLVMQGLRVLLLPGLGRHMGITIGPLVAALLLFFVPSFTLGTLSPFAITLANQTPKKRGVGTIAGELFFFSTVGSIFGSLLAGYVLIPHFAISSIVIGTGIVLVFLGLTPLAFSGLTRWNTGVICLASLTALTLASLDTPPTGVVYSHNGLYGNITIIDAVQARRPVRFLLQDRSTSGVMYLDGSAEPRSDYAQYYVLPEAFGKVPRQAAVLGGGMYAVPRALIERYPQAIVDVAEIEPSLADLSERYFRVPRDPRLRSHVADARRFLQDSKGQYDFIFSDVYYSLYSVPMHLTTKQFLEIAHAHLTNGGVFMANVIDVMDNRPTSLLRAEVNTLARVFPNVYVFAVEGPTYRGVQNFMVVAQKGGGQLSFNTPAFRGSPYAVVRSLPVHQVPLSRLGIDRYPVLTDDFAPVENWAASLARTQFH